MRRLAVTALATAGLLGLGLGGRAGEAVSLAVRPPVNPTTAYGSVATGKAGEKVTVQFRQCGLYPAQFRDVADVTTAAGGSWSVDIGAPTNGTFRALSGGAASNDVSVLVRVDVRLAPHGSRKYQINVVATLPFWRKRVLLQRFDRSRSAWVNVRKLVLDNTFGPGLIWSTTDRFTVKLPKGTTIRAVLPLDQAKPCFLAGYSNLLRT